MFESNWWQAISDSDQSALNLYWGPLGANRWQVMPRWRKKGGCFFDYFPFDLNGKSHGCSSYLLNKWASFDVAPVGTHSSELNGTVTQSSLSHTEMQPIPPQLYTSRSWWQAMGCPYACTQHWQCPFASDGSGRSMAPLFRIKFK